MDLLARMKEAALLAAMAGLVAWLPGCGGKDEATNPPVAGGGAPSQELAAVDPADVSGYEGWLKANGVDAPEVSLSSHRGGGGDTSIWPLVPRGEVRLDGLTVWRLEVDLDNYDPAAGGVLEFRKGKNVLWRDTAPFDPKDMRLVQGGLPKSVLDAVKVGDTVTWGIAFDAKPKSSMMGEFKVVSKPSAAKQIDRLENDRQNARQPAKVKALGRGQALLNNSLYAEALLTYMDLAVGTGNDPIVQEAGYRIVECMRRLGLDEAPLYSDAMQLAGARKGKSQGKAGTEPSTAGTPSGLAGVAPYTPTDRPLVADATPAPQPTAQPTPTNRSKPTSDKARRAVAAVEQQASVAQATAAEADARARALEEAGASQAEQMAALKAKAEALAGTPEGEEAAKRLAQSEAALQRSKEAAAAAAGQAADAKQDADMMAKLRALAEAGEPARGEPGNADSKLAAMVKNAQGMANEAAAKRAQAEKLDRAADAAEADGKGDAADMRAKADAAAAAAAAAVAKSSDAQKAVEKAMLAMEAMKAKDPKASGPSDADRVAVLAGWAGRLSAEAETLRAEAEKAAEAAAKAEASGAADAATLRAQAEDAAKAAAIAAQRATSANEALEALRALQTPADGK